MFFPSLNYFAECQHNRETHTHTQAYAKTVPVCARKYVYMTLNAHIPAVAECCGQLLLVQPPHQALQGSQGSARATGLPAQHLQQPPRVAQLERQLGSRGVVTILQDMEQAGGVVVIECQAL